MKTVSEENMLAEDLAGGDAEVEGTLRRLNRLAVFYDSAFGIPGTSLKIGWDSIFGLIPGIGDLLGVAPLFYYLQVVRKYRLGWGLAARIIFNQTVDFVIGSIPLVGDLFDWAFKANLKNARLLADRLVGSERNRSR